MKQKRIIRGSLRCARLADGGEAEAEKNEGFSGWYTCAQARWFVKIFFYFFFSSRFIVPRCFKVAKWNWCRVSISLSVRWALFFYIVFLGNRTSEIFATCTSWQFHTFMGKVFSPQSSSILFVPDRCGEEGIDFGCAVCHKSLTILTSSNASGRAWVMLMLFSLFFLEDYGFGWRGKVG